MQITCKHHANIVESTRIIAKILDGGPVLLPPILKLPAVTRPTLLFLAALCRSISAANALMFIAPLLPLWIVGEPRLGEPREAARGESDGEGADRPLGERCEEEPSASVGELWTPLVKLRDGLLPLAATRSRVSGWEWWGSI